MTTIPGFLTKTYEIFNTPEYTDCCGWGNNGSTIVIKKVRLRLFWNLNKEFICTVSLVSNITSNNDPTLLVLSTSTAFMLWYTDWAILQKCFTEIFQAFKLSVFCSTAEYGKTTLLCSVSFHEFNEFISVNNCELSYCYSAWDDSHHSWSFHSIQRWKDEV